MRLFIAECWGQALRYESKALAAGTSRHPCTTHLPVNAMDQPRSCHVQDIVDEYVRLRRLNKPIKRQKVSSLQRLQSKSIYFWYAASCASSSSRSKLPSTWTAPGDFSD